MTASLISAAVVADRLRWIEAMVAGIRALPLDSLDAFAADPRNPAAAESYLRRALEALMDLGRHILAKGHGQPAAEYRDIPQFLAANDVIGSGDREAWLKMAGYRNRMVHFYAEISRAELYEICSAHLDDIENAAMAIRRWLKAHPHRIDTAL
jgi:uncharacterized protein YutE (UPF0331/DUF86 family)